MVERLLPAFQVLLAISLILVIAEGRGQAQTESVLYNFCSQANCSDGEYSSATLVADGAGNFYGTAGGGSLGGGIVFELSPDGNGGWSETVLYNFCVNKVGCTDGAGPTNVMLDAEGNLYGTTTDGGDGDYPSAGVIMDSARNLYGTNIEVAYELSPAGGGWTLQTIYNLGSSAP